MELFVRKHGEEDFETLDDQAFQYMVPFFIWANYDIEEKNVELTSLNYLSIYLMEAAGLPLSSYQQFLKDTETTISAINSKGFYSLDNQCFMKINEAQGNEKKVLLKYQQIQYNGIFDEENRSKVFFSVN